MSADRYRDKGYRARSWAGSTSLDASADLGLTRAERPLGPFESIANREHLGRGNLELDRLRSLAEFDTDPEDVSPTLPNITPIFDDDRLDLAPREVNPHGSTSVEARRHFT